MTDTQLIALMAATIFAGGGFTREEAIKTAREFFREVT